MPSLIRSFLAAGMALALGMALAGCTITSQHSLIGADEGAAPLPDAFTLIPYRPDDGGYVPSTDLPVAFDHEGNRYVGTRIPDTKGPLSVGLVPLDEGRFLVAASVGGEPGVVYGFARYSDSVLSIALAPNKHTAAAISRERRTAMPQERYDLRGLSIDPRTRQITLKRRTALNFLAEMSASVKLPRDPPAVGYGAEDATAPPPSRLVVAGRDWIKVP